MLVRWVLAFLFVLGLALEPAWSDPAASDDAWIAAQARVAAPKLALRDLAGQKRQLSALKGKVVVVNFWATWCGPCRREMPAFSEVHAAYKDRGVEVIGAANETKAARDNVAEFVRRLQIGFPVWLEASADHMQAFGVGDALPATAIVDQQGRVAARIEGEADATRLRSLIDRLLLEAPAGAASVAQGPPAAQR
jgi:thiol-disulfide isomerase/thioredoxin